MLSLYLFFFQSPAFSPFLRLSTPFPGLSCNALCTVSGLLSLSQRDIGVCMNKRFSTLEAAKKLGVTRLTLQRHVASKTVKAPPLQKVGGVSVRLWSAHDIEKARKVLAGTRPGRKKKA